MSEPAVSTQDRATESDVPVPALPSGSRWVGLLVLSLLAVAAAMLAGVAVGNEALPFSSIWRTLLGLGGAVDERHRTILLELRLPGVALMAVTGAALGAAGCAYQGLFRNPLADPYIIGVAAGAGLGATGAIALGLDRAVGAWVLPVAAFIGGSASVGAVLLLAQVGRRTPVATMLLAGVAVGSLATALQTFWMVVSSQGELQQAFYWVLGGGATRDWDAVAIVGVCLIHGLIVLQFQSRALNVLQLDEEQAVQLGVSVERLKLTVLGSATLMTAAAVSFGGLIGFVGLVVPHVMRLLSGPDYRRLLLFSALGGAVLLMLADVVSRSLFMQQALPVGVITPLIGAPFFLFLLLRWKRSVF